MTNAPSTLRRRLILSSMRSIILSVVIFSLLCYLLLNLNAHRNQASGDEALARQISENTFYAVGIQETLIRDLCYSSEIQRLLLGYREVKSDAGVSNTERDARLTAIRRDVNNAIVNISRANRTFQNVILFSIDGEVLGAMSQYNANASIQDYPWFQELIATQGESLWLPEGTDPNNWLNPSASLLPVAKKVRCLEVTGSPPFASDIGYLLVYVDPVQLASAVNLGVHMGNRNLLLATGEGDILGGLFLEEFGRQLPFSPAQEHDEAFWAGGNRYLITVQSTRRNEWYAVCLSDDGAISRDANVAMGTCTLVAGLFMVVFFITSRRNADSVVKPITDLRNAFKRVEAGDFTAHALPEAGIAELDDLFARYGVMVGRLDTLVNDVYQSRLKEQQMLSEVQQTQIEALQMQINPHFIYNTLDSINWMALMGGREDIGRMVTALGEFLRFNVNMNRLYCTVEDEVNNTGRFMYIQHVRFEPRLSYSFHVQEDLYPYKILKLSLQPVVENAIRHGMEPMAGNVHVDVEITLRRGRLCVTVRDDGVGMTEEVHGRLSDMWQRILRGESVQGKVGVANLMKRLYLCYGTEAEFAIDSRPGFGTAIEITIPAQLFMEGV